MSRRSLQEIQAGRDPKFLAENVKNGRLELGWSMRKLAREANISFVTLLNIERGKGCTPLVERKLAPVLRVLEGALWHRIEKKWYSLRPTDTCRWYFLEDEDCRRYCGQHDLLIEGEPVQFDPDEIQDENERLRLGHAGLSVGFIRTTSALLTAGTVGSSVTELFRRMEDNESPVGVFVYLYCLRHAIRINVAKKVFELHEGDVLTLEMRHPFIIEPLKPVGNQDKPPLYIWIEADPWRTVPLPDRPLPASPT